MTTDEKTAQDIWNEELANDTPADLKLSQQAQGASTNGEALGAQESSDHGATGMMEREPVKPAAPAAAAAVTVEPPKEKTLDERLDEMRRTMQAEFDQRERKLQGEIEALRSAAGKQAAAAVTQDAPTTTAPTKEQIQAAGKSLEKWEKLKTEFPEWVEAFEERLSSMTPAAPTAPDFTQERERLTGEIAKARTEIRDELTVTMENRFVERVHRGWKQTIATREFGDWYQKQDADVRKLGASPIAEDAIELLDLYKAHQAAEPSAVRTSDTADDLKAQNRERLARASSAPTGQRGSGKQSSGKSPEDMTAEEYWNYLAAQDEQKEKSR